MATGSYDIGLWSIMDAGQVTPAELAGWLGVSVETVNDWRSLGITHQGRIMCRSALGIVDAHILRGMHLDDAKKIVDRWRRVKLAGRKCREQIQIPLVYEVARQLNRVSTSRMAKVLRLDMRTMNSYLRGVARTQYVVALRLADIMRVSIEELQGDITAERMDETVRHMQDICSLSNSRQGKLDRRKRIQTVDIVQTLSSMPADARVSRKPKSWPVRTCRACGARYQVGSMTTCCDCILGAI